MAPKKQRTLPSGIPARTKRSRITSRKRWIKVSIYFDPSHPGSFSVPDKLYRAVKADGKFKIEKYKITRWLKDQEAYALTKGVRRQFQRSRIIVDGIDSQGDVDLIDVKELACRYK